MTLLRGLDRRIWLGLGLIAAVAAGPSIGLIGRGAMVDGISLFGPYLALMGLCAAICVANAVRYAGAERRFWAFMAVALVGLLVGDGYFAWYSVVHDPWGPSVPGWFEIAHLVSAVALLAVVVNTTEAGREHIFVRLRLYSEVLAGCVVVIPIVYLAWTRPSFAEVPGTSDALAVIGAVYPVFGLLLCAVSLPFLHAGRARVDDWRTLAGATFAAYGFGMIGWPESYKALLLTADPLAHRGSITAASVVSGYALAAAAYLRLKDTSGSRLPSISLRPRQRVSWRWAAAVVPSFLVLIVPVYVFFAHVSDSREVHDVVMVAGVALAIIVASRSVLQALERGRVSRLLVSDAVTGVGTHRSLQENLRDRVESADGDSPLSVVLLDVDGFQRINMLHGHMAGDMVLARVARVLEACSPVRDSVFRSGGDEFALVIGLSESAAIDLADRCRREIGRSVRIAEMPVSVSVGVATLGEHAHDAEELLACALSAQYCARFTTTTGIAAYREDSAAELDPEHKIAQVKKHAQRTAVRALAEVVDARDGATRDHSRVVAELAARLGEKLGLPPQKVRLLELAAEMHDVGKIAVPDQVLTKSWSLTRSERDLIGRHPLVGERVLRSTGMPEVAGWVRWHHERWDGLGYPDGISGHDIPLESRILSVCDAFEAMTADRPYRCAMSIDAALQEIDLCMGSQFDPVVADAFIMMIADRSSMPGHARSVAG